MDNNKLNPYSRLKMILNEGKETLTQKGSKNLDELLGESQKKTSIWSLIIGKLKNIDNLIFSRKSKLYSNQYHKR